jgi:hypothetical protein
VRSGDRIQQLEELVNVVPSGHRHGASLCRGLAARRNRASSAQAGVLARPAPPNSPGFAR